MSAQLNAARWQLRQLSSQALAATKDPTLTSAQIKGILDTVEPQIDKLTKTVQDLQSLEQRSKSFDALDLGSLNPGAQWYGSGDAPQVTRKNLPGPGELPQVGAAPNLVPSEDQIRQLHDAVLSHKSLRVEVETKDVSSNMPASLVPSMVPLSHEPTRILDLLPTAAMNTPSVAYLRHVSTTGTAGMVAPAGLKPSVTLNVDKLEARAKKIAVLTTVNDEDLSDFAAFFGYVQTELTRLVIDQENTQVLVGDGTGENLTGIFATTGILTRVKGAAPETGIDTLAMAVTDLRNGLAKVAATVYAMNPTTWLNLRLLKDGQGRYLLGNPAEQDASRLWGVPVVQTTGIAVGTVLAANPPAAATAHIRQGLIVQVDYGTAGFEHNQTSVRAESRIALAVTKPSAAIRVTGL